MKHEQAIAELERTLKYFERQLEEFKSKLQLLNEQKEQYESDIIPSFEKKILEVRGTITILQEMDDCPF